MAERVVDGLEAVEVDELQRHVARRRDVQCRAGTELFVELNPVREPRKIVITREIGDALLGALTLGDILEDHHRAAVGHHAPRQRNGLFTVGRDSCNCSSPAACRPPHQLIEHLLRLLALVIAGPDAMTQQLRQFHADPHRRFLEMQQIEETPVPNLQAILLIEHAKAVRHVVERDVETVGLLLEAGRERRLFAGHGEGLNDDFTDAEGDVHHAVHEQQHRRSRGFCGSSRDRGKARPPSAA